MDNAWRVSSVEFYDREATEKASARRHRLFIRHYRGLRQRLGLDRGAWLLDAGCGCGEMTGAFQGTGLRVVGVDLSRRSLEQARAFHPGEFFLCADLHRLPFKPGIFHAVSAVSSLEFCSDKPAVLEEWKRVTRGDARFYVDARSRDFLLFRLPIFILHLLEKLGMLLPFPAEGFRDLSLNDWRNLFFHSRFFIEKEYPSLWPWNFGNPVSKMKNLVIHIVKIFFPPKCHYMAGFLLRNDSSPSCFSK
jgi:SAM-dependent methyltransferase